MSRTDAGTQRSLWWILTTIFAVAVGFNYVWELAQSPLYLGMDDFSRMLWHCFVAAVGDGLLVLLILGVGWAVLGRQNWFVSPGVRGYALMLATGLLIAITVEWALLAAGKWAYNDRMPIVPLLGLGLAPVAQMLLLPPLIFYVVACRAAWRTRTARDTSGNVT